MSFSNRKYSNHIKRIHIKHLQCMTCGQRFGGHFELNRHLNPEKIPKGCVMKEFEKLPPYVISHAERITHCSLEELQQTMFSGLEKSYDAQDGTDSKYGTKNLISMSAKVV